MKYYSVHIQAVEGKYLEAVCLKHSLFSKGLCEHEHVQVVILKCTNTAVIPKNSQLMKLFGNGKKLGHISLPESS